MVRLAYGVVAGRDLGVWAPGPDGVPVDASRAATASAVVVGPRQSDPGAVAAAVAGLRDLVAAGGTLAAGAGVDVGGGLWTARLAGATGDRRDAVIAALTALGVDGANRLGDRAGVLVALFGPSATKPVGAAATAALDGGRLAVLQLASAASDVLGPEQLERVLRLEGPRDLMAQAPGLTSLLATHLGRVLGPLSKPRRLTILLSLWDCVVDRWNESERRRRRRALADVSNLDSVRQRYQWLVDQDALDDVSNGEHARAVDLARWVPEAWHWQQWLNRTMHDAWAATALARVAFAVSDHGLESGLERTRDQLAAADLLLTKYGRNRAKTKAVGQDNVPARPGVYVWEIADRYRPGEPVGATTAEAIRSRLALAYSYATVTLDAAQDLVRALAQSGLADLDGSSACQHLRQWREVVGYSPARPPGSWELPTVPDRGPSLSLRLAERPGAAPDEVEDTTDLLWLAELADVVAEFGGYPQAEVADDQYGPRIDTRPPGPPAQPLRPSEDSLALALAGAAQLVDLGAEVPPRPRAWFELVDALVASTGVAESLTGAFKIPDVLRGRDGAAVPGTDVTIELAHDAHQLAEWAAYMGNCIAGPGYIGPAKKGRCVLVALRGVDARIVANLELYPHRNGWRINEFRARFNNDPEPDLAERVTTWIATLPAPKRPRTTPPSRPHTRTGSHRPKRRLRVLADARAVLAPVAGQAMEADGTVRAVQVMAQLRDGAEGGMAGVTALRRARRADVGAALRTALTDGRLDLLTLWRATAVRPLATALAELAPEVRADHAFMELLVTDAPLHTTPRRLARVAAIAEARTVEIVARRLRRALGDLVRGVDPLLDPLVPRDADTGLLCALVLTVSAAPAGDVVPVTVAGEPAVPGFPSSTLDDTAGPWWQAVGDAAELGAQVPPLPPDLVVPRGWLGRGGWPALWARAHRRQPSQPPG